MPELLCRVNFPLYQATMITSRHLLVAGGGGAANTGVFNGIEIFEISHNGEGCTTESVKRFSTREFAVMNCASGSHDTKSQKTIIAVGHNEKCQLYSCQLARELLSSPEETEVTGRNGVTNRNSTNGPTGHLESRLTFHIEPLNSVQTDFNTPEPYQKVVRISYDSKLLVTGGDDGILRVWTFPDLNAIHEIEAHDKEIDDIEFSPDNTKVVTISKDGRALVWDVKKGKKTRRNGLGSAKQNQISVQTNPFWTD
jgi:prolactin regulatory element-binding protein